MLSEKDLNMSFVDKNIFYNPRVWNYCDMNSVSSKTVPVVHWENVIWQCSCCRDIKPSHFVSELEHGKKAAQFLMQHVPHIIPFSEVRNAQSVTLLFDWTFMDIIGSVVCHYEHLFSSLVYALYVCVWE